MKNKLTSIFGLLSGASLTVSAFWKEYQPLLQALSGLAVVIMGYFAKDAPKSGD